MITGATSNRSCAQPCPSGWPVKESRRSVEIWVFCGILSCTETRIEEQRQRAEKQARVIEEGREAGSEHNEASKFTEIHFCTCRVIYRMA